VLVQGTFLASLRAFLPPLTFLLQHMCPDVVPQLYIPLPPSSITWLDLCARRHVSWFSLAGCKCPAKLFYQSLSSTGQGRKNRTKGSWVKI